MGVQLITYYIEILRQSLPLNILDRRSRPRQRIIEEVMGRYTEVSPIEKVSCTIIESDPNYINSNENYHRF